MYLNLPWVYSVAVRKQWPNELKIYVVDQNPVALWNGDFLINQAGKFFKLMLNGLIITFRTFLVRKEVSYGVGKL